MEIPTAKQFNERFLAAALRHNADITELDHHVSIARLGSGPRLGFLGGLHGDERSGPLALLRWFEDTPTGALIPDGISLWVAPLVNTPGWDADSRHWHDEKDLNRSFTDDRAPDFLRLLMADLADPLPAMYIDLHEDESSEAHYYFIYKRDTHDLAQRMAAALESNLVEWDDDDHWTGSSETFVRGAGCPYATTTEAVWAQSLDERIDWQLRTIFWCRDNVLTVVPG
jgi:predicted deacylase